LAEPSTCNVNGWTLCMHPLFEEQYRSLITEVTRLKQINPDEYQNKHATKRLAAINKLIYDIIPSNPANPEFRQGKTLGEKNKHWFRAKFFQQYRLFFRYHRRARIIVYVWVNDEKSKRAYESKSDAYRVFAHMLASGNPPDDWDALLEASNSLRQRR